MRWVVRACLDGLGRSWQGRWPAGWSWLRLTRASTFEIRKVIFLTKIEANRNLLLHYRFCHSLLPNESSLIVFNRKQIFRLRFIARSCQTLDIFVKNHGLSLTPGFGQLAATAPVLLIEKRRISALRVIPEHLLLRGDRGSVESKAPTDKLLLESHVPLGLGQALCQP